MSTRRNFLKGVGAVSGLGLLSPMMLDAKIPPRPKKAKYMGDFAAPKLPVVKCAFIGVGARGSGHCNDIGKIPGTKIVGVCDLYKDLAERSVKSSKAKGHTDAKAYFGGPKEYLKMFAETKPDAVFISTNWNSHAEHCIEAMKAGAHAFCEVPIAVTIDEMWKIVDTSEATQKHCMMMENVNYGGAELLYLNMCRKGVLGQLLHAEAAYIHTLRGQMNSVKRGTGSWRTFHYAKRNGNLYPTHGLGPVAQYMNLARGEDTFASMVSYSTPALGRQLYAKAKYPAGHQWNKLDFKGGDMNTTLIKTKLGRTIMVQWDETTPRPYSRHNLIQGTKGVLAGFPNRIAVEGLGNAHRWAEGADFKKQTEKFKHPLIKRLQEKVNKLGLKGHGGMDGMMRMRIIECLQEGLPLDQNVYEGCFWSAVGPLSETSVANNGAPQAFPDFTRGEWKNTKPLAVDI
ncbi:MAG: Gfo/Idh/MocA family oxidoreductase [Phycisphaerales bacterium]|jgi:predicted dehydrogenase|nr:Gfo/Idh/MocA family oxidoreductase [Phycisphaerales bacterium]